MELYILAGIAYFLILIVVMMFFGGVSILNEDYDETSDDIRRALLLHDAEPPRPSADVQPTSTSSCPPPSEDQTVAMGRQAVRLDKRATRSEIA